MSYTIKDGKFYLNGEPVKPEFGNWEQIEALKQFQKKVDEGVFDAELHSEEVTRFYPLVKFDCPFCGTKNKHEFEDDESEWHIDNDDVDGLEVSCTGCDKEFEITKVKGKNHTITINLIKDE